MLQKGGGNSDLWITKPVGRPQLLLYKYLGGLTFVALLSVVAVGGTWVAARPADGRLVVPVPARHPGADGVLRRPVRGVRTGRRTHPGPPSWPSWSPRSRGGCSGWGGKLDAGVQNRRELAAKLAENPIPPPISVPKPGEQPDPDEIIQPAGPGRPVIAIRN